MTPDELSILRSMEPARIPVPKVDGGDRTLLYGFDTESRTHHVYLKDGLVHQVIYSPSDPNREKEIHHYAVGDEIDVETLIPNKRLYPEACDFDFCRALKELSFDPVFTHYGMSRVYKEGESFTGHVFDDRLAPSP